MSNFQKRTKEYTHNSILTPDDINQINDDIIEAKNNIIEINNNINQVNNEVNETKNNLNTTNNQLDTKLDKSAIIDNLTSTNPDQVLSANMGRQLQTNLDNSKVIVNNTLTSESTTQALSANMGRELKNSIPIFEVNTVGKYTIPNAGAYYAGEPNSRINLSGKYFGDIAFNGSLTKIDIQYTMESVFTLTQSNSVVVDIEQLLMNYSRMEVVSVFCTQNGASVNSGGTPIIATISNSQYIKISIAGKETTANPYKLNIQLCSKA